MNLGEECLFINQVYSVQKYHSDAGPQQKIPTTPDMDISPDLEFSIPHVGHSCIRMNLVHIGTEIKHQIAKAVNTNP